MGNQASNGHGQYGHVRHRRDSDGPPILPPHVPIPAAAAIVNNTIGRPRERRHSENQDNKTGPIDARLRQLSGDNERTNCITPSTFETPPCITIKPGRRAAASPVTSEPSEYDHEPVNYFSISPSSSDTGNSNVGSPACDNVPITPISERYTAPMGDDDTVVSETRIRPRAMTTTHGARDSDRSRRQRVRLVPTVFKYSKNPKADDVYLTGTMTGWRCVRMSQPEGEVYWVHIQDSREGKHYYKFLVDGVWSVEDSEVKVDKEDKQWNVMEVKRSDFEVFDALACDSFSLKNSDKNKSEKNFKSDSWCQVSPNFEKLDVKCRNPPTLPPHLLQVILNKDVSYQPDPILLEEPSHVMLNHLYAQAIRDDLLVLSSTQRFRKKYVTTLLYKPI